VVHKHHKGVTVQSCHVEKGCLVGVIISSPPW
jgi:hypothetical protein